MNPEICTFEEWKSNANSISINFVNNNPDLFSGFLNNEAKFFTKRYQIDDVNIIPNTSIIDFLEQNISNNLQNYLHSIDIVNVYTPERYDENQLAVFEKEKTNFSARFSEAFLNLPTAKVLILKYKTI